MAGRKSKFKKEYCDMLIEHMKLGKSFETFAGKIRVSRRTLYDWVESYPEFKEAKEIAFPGREFFVEDKILKVATGEQRGNAVLLKMLAVNTLGWKAGDDDSEKDKKSENKEIKIKLEYDPLKDEEEKEEKPKRIQ